jgi:hypothetical protein
MDRDEKEKLEKERAKLEEARARLEDERDRVEDERQRLEDERDRIDDEMERLEEEAEEMKEEDEEAAREKVEERMEELRKKAERLTGIRHERLEKMAEQIERSLEGVQEEIENRLFGIDFGKMEEDLRNSTPKMKGGPAQTEKDIEISLDRDTKNVGILNLKDITPEELDKLGEIRNSGVIIVPEELMGKLSSKVTKNIGEIIPYRKGWRIYSGQTDIDKSMLDALEEPIEFIHIGQMTISKDVTADIVKAKIKAFHNYGHVSATEATYGIIMARCLENYGQISRDGDDGDEDAGPREHRHKGHSTDRDE